MACRFLCPFVPVTVPDLNLAALPVLHSCCGCSPVLSWRCSFCFSSKIIGRKWHEEHPEAKMYGETRSYARHEHSMPEGMTHIRRKFREEKGIKCPNVVFCANPGGELFGVYPHRVLRVCYPIYTSLGSCRNHRPVVRLSVALYPSHVEFGAGPW